MPLWDFSRFLSYVMHVKWARAASESESKCHAGDNRSARGGTLCVRWSTAETRVERAGRERRVASSKTLREQTPNMELHQLQSRNPERRTSRSPPLSHEGISTLGALTAYGFTPRN